MRPHTLFVALFVVAAGACRPAPSPHVPAASQPASAPAASASPASAPHGGHGAAHVGHDLAHPPIDCPLAKAGVRVDHLRPFADTTKYIAFLDRPDRAVWQKPDEVVTALRLAGTETVADLGAGSGYFSFRLARAVPRGRVLALDVEPEMVRHVHHKVMTESIANVSAVLAKTDDPGVSPAVDLVFICDVLHHVQDRPAWLRRLVAEMRPGARVALIEFREGPLPQGPPESVKIPKAELVRLMAAAGLRLDGEKTGLLPYQHFLLFRKP
jgi:SAM-dependent methyltransferase